LGVSAIGHANECPIKSVSLQLNEVVVVILSMVEKIVGGSPVTSSAGLFFL
jgi:hypothetical protein